MDGNFARKGLSSIFFFLSLFLFLFFLLSSSNLAIKVAMTDEVEHVQTVQ